MDSKDRQLLTFVNTAPAV